MLKLVIFVVVSLVVIGILAIVVCLNSNSYYEEDFERKEKEEK